MELCIVSNSVISRQASLMPIDLVNAEKSLRGTISFYSPDKLDAIHDDKVYKTMNCALQYQPTPCRPGDYASLDSEEACGYD